MRYEISDCEWNVIRPMLPNKARGIPRVDDRRVLNGIFWVLRSRAPWRDLPGSYGSNFAIRGDLAQGFLRANGVEPILRDPSTSSASWTRSEVAKYSQAYTVHVICAGAATTAAMQTDDRLPMRKTSARN
jgi:transposase